MAVLMDTVAQTTVACVQALGRTVTQDEAVPVKIDWSKYTITFFLFKFHF